MQPGGHTPSAHNIPPAHIVLRISSITSLFLTSVLSFKVEVYLNRISEILTSIAHRNVPPKCFSPHLKPGWIINLSMLTLSLKYGFLLIILVTMPIHLEGCTKQPKSLLEHSSGNNKGIIMPSNRRSISITVIHAKCFIHISSQRQCFGTTCMGDLLPPAWAS